MKTNTKLESPPAGDIIFHVAGKPDPIMEITSDGEITVRGNPTASDLEVYEALREWCVSVSEEKRIRIAMEAAVAFAAWLTAREGTLKVGEKHSTTAMLEAVTLFCDLNGLDVTNVNSLTADLVPIKDLE